MENQRAAAARQRLTEYLERKGLLKTPERFVMLEEIYQRDGHVDVDGLYDAMLNRKLRVSRTTVYNNLEIMAECGLVRKLRFGTNKARYEKALGCRQHHHLVCLDCRKVIDFCDPRLGQIQQGVGDTLGFLVHGHELVIYGHCNQTGCER